MKTPIDKSKRQALGQLILGGSALGFRSMVSGLPISLLANPTAFLQTFQPEKLAAAGTPQYFILATSDDGEPMNSNVPGMYGDPNINHPKDPSMAATSFALGGQTVTAAKAWSRLSSQLLNRSSFFHYQTMSFQHGTIEAIQGLQGHMRRANMLVSLMSQSLSAQLGTIQAAPISLCHSRLIFNGRIQPYYGADTLKNIMGSTPSLAAINSAIKLRDRDVAAINAVMKTNATTQQRATIDSWINSQRLARAIPEDIIDTLNAINDDSFASKLRAGVALFKAKVTPVINVPYRMGADNHTDQDLLAETTETNAFIDDMNTFASILQANGLSDNVSFATLDVFGRTNVNHVGIPYVGRDHNGLHVCSIAIGKNFAPSVIGGATLQGRNAVATNIDPITGKSVPSGGIDALDTLVSYGATLAAGLKADTADVLEMFNEAPVVVKSALA